jgi:hypothetical protein
MSKAARNIHLAAFFISTRTARDAAKLQKSEGIDPIEARKVDKLTKAATVAAPWFRKLLI